MSRRLNVGGTVVDTADTEELLGRIDTALGGGSTRDTLIVASSNLEHVYRFGPWGSEAGLIEGSSNDWVVSPDGAPVAAAVSKIVGAPVPRLTGADLLPEVLDLVDGRTVAVFGATTETQDLFAEWIAANTTADLVSVWSPDLSDPACDLDSLCTEVAESAPDLLILALPTGPQERVAEKLASLNAARVVLCFGAALDFLLGVQRRAPEMFRNAGVEWLWRLLSQPKRMATRYLVRGPRAAWQVRRNSGQAAPAPLTASDVRSRISSMLLAGDAVLIVTSLAAAFFARYMLSGRLGMTGFEGRWSVVLVSALIVFATCSAAGAYKPQVANIDSHVFKRFLGGVVLGTMLAGFFSFAVEARLSRGYVTVFVTILVVCGSLFRLWLRAVVRRRRLSGRWLVRVVVVGSGAQAERLVDRIREHPESGFVPVALLEGFSSGPDVRDAVVRHHVGMVMFVAQGSEPSSVAALEESLHGVPTELSIAPSLFNFDVARIRIGSVGASPLLFIDHPSLSGVSATVKRVLDVVVALVALVVTSPLILFAAYRVRAFDGGPAFLRQRRVGRNGNQFDCFKLRTMVLDADAYLVELGGGAGVENFKLVDDPRVTKPGRWCRRWSVDELPQLLNVLRGEMSLVGPRPRLPHEVFANEAHRRRLLVRPGLTGLWQVSGRSDLSPEEAMSLDLYYVANWKLSQDLVLLMRTLKAVFSGHGAY